MHLKNSIVSLGVALLCAASSIAGATLYDGNQLHEVCQSKEPAKIGLCMGFVTGFIEAMLMDDGAFAIVKVCMPGGTTVLEITDVVRRHLEASPNTRHHAAGVIVVFALSEAFPCGK